jgi:hypothetical protein
MRLEDLPDEVLVRVAHCGVIGVSRRFRQEGLVSLLARKSLRDGGRLLVAMRAELLRIARNEKDELHDALLVRAPRIVRSDTELLEALRPSIVRTIRSERVNGRYVYGDVSDVGMAEIVGRIGRSRFVNAYRANGPDRAFRHEVNVYERECEVPVGHRSVLRERGPMCFWDTSGVEDLREALYGKHITADLMWPTHNVRTMSFLFAKSTFNGRIGHWDVSRVESMAGLFYENEVFEQPIDRWDTRKVQNVWHMFFGAKNAQKT